MARRRQVEEEDVTETLVKVGRTGGRVEEYSLEGDEPTVADALQAAGITISKGDRIRLNGETATEDDEVQSGDIVTIAGKVSGGSN
jgi:sulfur carrier protein ThiS